MRTHIDTIRACRSVFGQGGPRFPPPPPSLPPSPLSPPFILLLSAQGNKERGGGMSGGKGVERGIWTRNRQLICRGISLRTVKRGTYTHADTERERERGLSKHYCTNGAGRFLSSARKLRMGKGGGGRESKLHKMPHRK